MGTYMSWQFFNKKLDFNLFDDSEQEIREWTS